jgi:hypothetical protein
VGLRQFFRDFSAASEESTPHRQAANRAQEEMITRLKEAENQSSQLSPEERSVRRREADDALEELRRESEAAHRPMDELQARYPRWIKE